MVRAVLLGPGGCMRLPSAEDILPPTVEGCSEPNAHPRINRTVTKYTSAVWYSRGSTPKLEPFSL